MRFAGSQEYISYVEQFNLVKFSPPLITMFGFFSQVMPNYTKTTHNLATLSPYYRRERPFWWRYCSIFYIILQHFFYFFVFVYFFIFNIMQHYHRIFLCIIMQHYRHFCCIMLRSYVQYMTIVVGNQRVRGHF